MALIDAKFLIEAVAVGVPGAEAQAFDLKGGAVGFEIRPEALLDVLRFLRDDPELGFTLFLDVTCIDHVADEGRLHLVYSLRSLANGRVVVKTFVPAEHPHTPTAVELFSGADWAEREVYDMFGVIFEGHPNLKRILMYEEFVGYPLLKEYPYDKRQPLVPERDPINDPWGKQR